MPPTTILFPSPVFGPVRSRRLGLSLGVNLMPADGKMCSFDCIYCECGLNANGHTTTPRPTRHEVRTALETTLQQMAANGQRPDVITFAGNGEPTLHPQFPDIIHDTLLLRNSYCPAAKVSVLSNATTAHRPKIQQALLLVDNNIQKLDTVNTLYINMVDRPTSRYNVQRTVEALAAFNGRVTVQTMFMGGTYEGKDVDNTGEAFVKPWLEALQQIRPQQVMIYTIDRTTPIATLTKATPQQLNAIQQRVEALGIPCSAAY